MDNNPFWQYSLNIYNRPAVATSVLYLQDSFDIDVNMLLCCCWLGSQRQALTISQISQILHTCDHWREHCILPIRSARRFLKIQDQSDMLYDLAKTLEIEIERRQQDLMFTCLSDMALECLFDRSTCSNDQVRDLMLTNLQSYTHCLKHVEWDQVVEIYQVLLSEING